MRFHIFATDFDGTLARDGKVEKQLIEKLHILKSSGRILVLVTGREMRYLIEDFPDYKIFDHIVAENGAVLLDPLDNKEIPLGEPPAEEFIQKLKKAGVHPISVGKVIVATWEPHDAAVLQVIKEMGIERQVIFNKAAVMILPTGISKASGLQKLLENIHYSAHNLMAVGDAENDSAMLALAECGVAVSNAIPALKKMADFVLQGNGGNGMKELMEQLITDDLKTVMQSSSKHRLRLGTFLDGKAFELESYGKSILLTGISGGGKTTLTAAFIETLIKEKYQFCLIDPEGDYLEVEDVKVIGNETSVPSIPELISLLKDPAVNLIICIVSIPLQDRPKFFADFLIEYAKLKDEYGHPHWIIVDEAHHLLPDTPQENPLLTGDISNILLITYSIDKLKAWVLKKIETLWVVGEDWANTIQQICPVFDLEMPQEMKHEPGQMLVWDFGEKRMPVAVHPLLPQKLLKRHKKKYAQGDMSTNSFVFTGPEGKLKLVAKNVVMFSHMAEGIDDQTWIYHLMRNDFATWFGEKVHDEELANISTYQGQEITVAESKKEILEFINANYRP